MDKWIEGQYKIGDEFDAYVTKYALLRGIVKCRVKYVGFNQLVRPVKGFSREYKGIGKEWHRTFDSALKMAQIMRLEKIEELEGKLESVKNLNFRRPE